MPIMKKHYDLLVIGGGSGGLACAKKAASYGASVALVEMDRIGGTCVNLGCVPKKIMWYAGEIASAYHAGLNYGFTCQDYTFDFEKLVTHRQQYITQLNQIYEQQLQDNNIDYYKDQAMFRDSHTIEIKNEYYTANHIVIASGCHPSLPSIQGAEFGIDSDGFFALKFLPKKIAIVGAGYIAIELASILNQLGAEVSLLIRHDIPLRHFDSLLGLTIIDIMTSQGIKVLTNHQATRITRDANNKLSIDCGNDKIVSDIDSLIFAIGRTPRTQHLNLNHAKINTNEAGFIITDKWERTNIQHIYAIGDVTGKKLLTPVAIAAGRQLAARIFGDEKDAYCDYENIPTVIFSHPPIGSIGLSEQEAIKKYGENQLTIYQTRFTSLLYSLNKDKTPSHMKLITLKPNEKIIGCHLIGPG